MAMDADAVEIRVDRRVRLRSVVVVMVASAGVLLVLWRAPLWVKLCLGGPAITYLALRVLLPVLDPRPMVRLEQDGVRFGGLFKTGSLRSSSYKWSEIEKVSPTQSGYVEPKVGRSHLYSESARRRSRAWAVDWFDVRTADGRKHRVTTPGGQWPLARLRAVIAAQAETG